jgi:hypothetical protein
MKKIIIALSLMPINLFSQEVSNATIYIYPKPGSEQHIMSAGKPISKNIEIEDIDCKIAIFYEGHFYNLKIEHSPACCPQID